MVNLNHVAVAISLREGKKKEVNIAQIKEVMKCLFEEMTSWDIQEIARVLKKYKR